MLIRKGKGIFRLLERPTEECYKKSIYSKEITWQFRYQANLDLYESEYNFAQNPKNVYNREADLEAKRLRKLKRLSKNKQNDDYDNDDNGNDGFGIN